MAKDKLSGAVSTARPYVERLAQDQELHDHLKGALESATWIYSQLLGDRGTTGMAKRVARDKDIQDEVKKALLELREAGRRAQGHDTHTTRNLAFLLVGISIGILFNPVTGPDTRRWLKDRMFGAEEPFEYTSNDA